MSDWALDIGTRNTVLARWDAAAGTPSVVRMPRLARDDLDPMGLAAPSVVPSAVEIDPEEGLGAFIARLPPFRDGLWFGRLGWIGRRAVERNATWPGPAYAPSFKGPLLDAPLRPLARAAGREWSARDVARVFLRELLAEAWRATLERPRRLVATAPVEAFEPYRAEVGALLAHLGLDDVRWVDEPVAAAVGYGLSARRPRRVLVVDFGAGSLDVVHAAIDAEAVAAGRAVVLGKAGRPLGGDPVDAWLLESVLTRWGGRLPREDDRFYERWLLEEARRVKEALREREREVFLLAPPESADPRHRGLRADPIDVTRGSLEALLERKGAYAAIDEAVSAALGAEEPDDVLLVGGSTLLPGVAERLVDRFGRDRVRAWHPFEAVALGAAHLAGTGFAPADFVVHDYAIVAHDARTATPHPVVVVPAGTRFPTAPDLWRDRFVPTCAHGLAEHQFKLVVCEMGPGRLVPLNEADPALGRLDPPHDPDDPTPRLDVAFGVDSDRWLVATVVDLRTGRRLLDRKPVVRLL